ncbi:Gfo/Idh/MocA family protein [Pararhizobium sp. PWRC1-1]|uniref:Gfo/Idh/MocA family protein n=1 Tax=Pararhizobium sp. PWRC1-1 TaxID=2804566 RepID=UPI003CEBD133
MSGPTDSDYALKSSNVRLVDAPVLNYLPPRSRSYAPGIAVIGAGGISSAHLDAYRDAGYDVRVICNRTLAKAEERRNAFFPQAEITSDIEAVLNRDDIEIVDITTHPEVRYAMIERALQSGKHVLSQKPFVLEVDAGLRLVELAEKLNLKLAVNQNGRWAPHLSYMREAVKGGLVGEIVSCHVGIHWNHGWIKGTTFETNHHLVFQDFAIHWFDFLVSLIGDRASSVVATNMRAVGQVVAPPLLAQALVQFEGGQASFVFNGATKYGPLDCTYICGTKGSLVSTGPSLGTQSVELWTERGVARPELVGTWFNDGFRGAMGELMCAIEDDRAPLHNARDNLASIALTTAAVRSAVEGNIVQIF